jgi:hypothetical protein
MEKVPNNPAETADNNPAENDWESLTHLEQAPQENDEAPVDKKEKLLRRAELYKKFGKVALALAALEKSMSKKESPNEQLEELDTPEDEQADALIGQIESALEDVDRSLANQIDYNIVNHKQINTKEALEQELQSGTSVPELDIRFDKDGKPWISHSPRAGARFLFSKHIHKLSSKEVAEIGQRLSLEDGLDIFQKYIEDNPNHKVVLEIKELGAAAEAHPELLANIKKLLEERGLTEKAIFATLSPSILKSVHDSFPENSKILNGGIAPVISYDIADKSLGDHEDKEFAFKIPGVELFFSNSTDVKDHADGYGKQTGYLWTRLPKETVDTLRRMNENGQVGAASLTVVNKFANVLDKVSPKTAEKLRRHYAEQLDKMGIRKQVAISKSNPRESLLRTKEQMGQDSIIYSDTGPGDWSADLPPQGE